MTYRALLSLILITTLLLAACGGGGDDDEDSTGADAGDQPSITADGGDSDSDTAGDDASATEAASGADSGENASQAATATLPPLSAGPTRTPRPTSTPFPTATPLPPRPTPTSLPQQSTGTPAPETSPETSVVTNIEITSSNVFRDPDAGSAIIFGELQNTSDVPATGVQVRARLHAAAGKLVGRGDGEAVGKTVVNPGDIVGFSIIVTFEDGVYAEWASEDLTVNFEFPRDQIVQSYTSDLTISGDTLVGPETDFDFVDVTGNLTNDSGMPLRFVQVGAIAYDADGNVISVDSFVTSETLEPGATIPFSVEFSRGRLIDFPANYVLVVEGLDSSS